MSKRSTRIAKRDEFENALKEVEEKIRSRRGKNPPGGAVEATGPPEEREGEGGEVGLEQRGGRKSKVFVPQANRRTSGAEALILFGPFAARLKSRPSRSFITLCPAALLVQRPLGFRLVVSHLSQRARKMGHPPGFSLGIEGLGIPPFAKCAKDGVPGYWWHDCSLALSDPAHCLRSGGSEMHRSFVGSRPLCGRLRCLGMTGGCWAGSD